MVWIYVARISKMLSIHKKIFPGSFRTMKIKQIAKTGIILEGKTAIVSYDKDFDKIDGVKRLEPKDLI